MRIAHLVPGSGGTFYCQNCLRDYSLVRALRKLGHDVTMAPLYLPPFNDEAGLERGTPVFFGGINVYLRERFALFRKTPRWIDRLFDLPWMLKLAASREGSTNAAALGPMTLSMLEGRSGHQKKGFARLSEWLVHHETPDVIHISNALLLGLAPELKRALDVPIACSLQDEEPWVEAMKPPYNRLCWDAMAENARYVDQFVSPSAWYAGRMRKRLCLTPDRIRIVPLGIDLEGIPEPGSAPSCPPMTLGFLSRISESLGFRALADSFVQLKQDLAFKPLRLRATGGCTEADSAFIESMRAMFRARGMDDSVEILPDFQKAQRNAFLQSLSVLSVPVPGGEAFGIELLEAMAHGVPVVQPNEGAYPEIIEATGGGILYDPAQPDGLTEALRTVLRDPEMARALGERGRTAVFERFGVDRAAADMFAVYESMRGAKP